MNKHALYHPRRQALGLWVACLLGAVPVVWGQEAPIVSPSPKAESALKRQPSVAVLAFSGEGMSAKELAAKDLNAITSRFEAELMASDSYQLVERRNIDKILKEQGFQQSGACNTSE